MRTIAVIPAGGQGKRFGGEVPKQYQKIHGKELIAYTLEIFQRSNSIDEIVVAAQPDYFGLLNELADKYRFTKLKSLVNGGKERQDSVFNAITSIKADQEDLIAVHDAARPLLSQAILAEAIKQARQFNSVLVCIKARDTLLKGQDFVSSFLDRNEVFYAQTPQIFKYGIIRKSLEDAFLNNFYGTDESMLVTRAGFKVKIVEGSVLNFKITTRPDFELFEKLCGVL
ncbi:MAG: 2-C-methyl-D-erythritol 4-phosphate cytidylyltransferase [Ignavibacteria bacterium]|jgi:2-C-methyl-D-erythritol 4-phosphate cytidylyltransferase|nr:2-C-methyl-D-erythritol 4-phosphate cytidylyltransferase [Ignavibacteria bacterium]MCU7502756.1 2-C-methyl-D-erythritol 4-phosphate cytidylyltransferase [Ignavibacteria bacterium]MCU7517315.1 2-C-methyl-D-erythritol 4-phosphate cytidylyltransferase [Ignavibacteria bacterium]